MTFSRSSFRMLVPGEGVVPCLGACLLIHNFAIFYSNHHIQWCSTEVLADGYSIFRYSGNFHLISSFCICDSVISIQYLISSPWELILTLTSFPSARYLSASSRNFFDSGDFKKDSMEAYLSCSCLLSPCSIKSWRRQLSSCCSAKHFKHFTGICDVEYFGSRLIGSMCLAP